jgi:hypothetical protein
MLSENYTFEPVLRYLCCANVVGRLKDPISSKEAFQLYKTPFACSKVFLQGYPGPNPSIVKLYNGESENKSIRLCFKKTL